MVDENGTHNGTGSGGSGGSGGARSSIDGLLIWEIDNSEIQGGGGEGSGGIANNEELVKVWHVDVTNDGPLLVYMINLKVANSDKNWQKRSTTTYPPVSLAHNAAPAPKISQNYYQIPPKSFITINITVDMRPVLIDPIVAAPRRKKAVQFQYTYGGPKAKVFSVTIPLKVSCWSLQCIFCVLWGGGFSGCFVFLLCMLNGCCFFVLFVDTGQRYKL